ncbi:hypothetical protein EVAR_102307_1 [Eumeta japonica]|uniref:Uncharacterized protein n=1 Tax=Eumeta variegata TaxID=151549 RepID=A0A4C1WG35_EUMVA|nr:hypothetical protein EVAR_102307_1 [Eumeta japonica]
MLMQLRALTIRANRLQDIAERRLSGQLVLINEYVFLNIKYLIFFFLPSCDEEEVKMSILHTLAPSVETSQMTSQTTLIASPSAAGRHMRVPTARDMRDDAWWKSSRHRMSQETVTGRFLPCSAGGG